ncbi:hypothetical protein BCR34DRAFT_359291 [Clohesyomyces aquaticus]|uniref:Uncharacterized protein n=1 Tax=Clohesyomyces aquaticus TaxID=1231657 RepID=A0A1Y1ZIC6_9PLEO|nr:hypothetical protein BCR34DRAFT_359291 [Clohesyomyces aquaticus]
MLRCDRIRWSSAGLHPLLNSSIPNQRHALESSMGVNARSQRSKARATCHECGVKARATLWRGAECGADTTHLQRSSSRPRINLSGRCTSTPPLPTPSRALLHRAEMRANLARRRVNSVSRNRSVPIGAAFGPSFIGVPSAPSEPCRLYGANCQVMLRR